jgi:hypothetical protein
MSSVNRFNVFASFALFAVASAACAPTDDAGSEAQATPELMAAATVKIQGVVHDLSQPLAGAQVCVLDHPSIPCATSAANGSYSLDLPAGANVEVSASLAEHVTTTIAFATGNEGFGYYVTLLPTATYAAYTQLATGSPADPNKGGILYAFYSMASGAFPGNNDDVAAGTVGIAGASVTTQPDAPPRTPISVLYNGVNGLPDPTLTSSAAAATTSSAGSLNVPAGKYVAHPSAPAGSKCNTRWLQEGSTGNSVALTVRPGQLTTMWLRCTPEAK